MTPELRVIEGGRGACYIRVRLDQHDELHAEVVVARAERLIHATEGRDRLRAALRHLAAQPPRLAACGTALLEALRIVEAEAQRATAMESPCACGLVGAGHGRADEDALAVPVESAA